MDELDPTDASTWPEIMTVEQAASVLRMTPKNVRKLLASGALKGKKTGGRRYVLKAPLLTPDEPMSVEDDEDDSTEAD